MTFADLRGIIEKNHIPEDVLLLSDSGWECDATDMDGVFYCKEKNTIVFTQGYGIDGEYTNLPGEWKLLASTNTLYQDKKGDHDNEPDH